MGALRAIALSVGFAAALTTAMPAAANPVDRWRPHIEEASQRFGVPAQWIERAMMAESGGRTELNGRPVVSRAGAMGLMQLMPGTWSEMRQRLRLGADPHAPRDNILAGTFYLRLMYDRFGYPGLFGAYNAGPARYAAFLAGRLPLPVETRDYLRKVVITHGKRAQIGPRAIMKSRIERRPGDGMASDAEPGLFFLRR